MARPCFLALAEKQVTLDDVCLLFSRGAALYEDHEEGGAGGQKRRDHPRRGRTGTPKPGDVETVNLRRSGCGVLLGKLTFEAQDSQVWR